MLHKIPASPLMTTNCTWRMCIYIERIAKRISTSTENVGVTGIILLVLKNITEILAVVKTSQIDYRLCRTNGNFDHEYHHSILLWHINLLLNILIP